VLISLGEFTLFGGYIAHRKLTDGHRIDTLLLKSWAMLSQAGELTNQEFELMAIKTSLFIVVNSVGNCPCTDLSGTLRSGSCSLL
jgi:hypothetical protein